jgi:hypothetical protein
MGVVFNRNGSLTASGIAIRNFSTLGYSWRDDSNTFNFNTGIVVPFNTWMHVAIAISPTNARFYVNGALSTTYTYSHAQIAQSNFIIGTDNLTANDRYFRGLIDNVLVYNTTLTDAQISSIYASTLVA